MRRRYEEQHFWELIVAAALASGRRRVSEAIRDADDALAELVKRYPPEEEERDSRA